MREGRRARVEQRGGEVGGAESERERTAGVAGREGPEVSFCRSSRHTKREGRSREPPKLQGRKQLRAPEREESICFFSYRLRCRKQYCVRQSSTALTVNAVHRGKPAKWDSEKPQNPKTGSTAPRLQRTLHAHPHRPMVTGRLQSPPSIRSKNLANLVPDLAPPHARNEPLRNDHAVDPPAATAAPSPWVSLSLVPVSLSAHSLSERRRGTHVHSRAAGP